jgi:hypothetical protein
VRDEAVGRESMLEGLANDAAAVPFAGQKRRELAVLDGRAGGEAADVVEGGAPDDEA